jgi:hypothetical protein
MPVDFPTEAAARAAFPRSLDCRVMPWNNAVNANQERRITMSDYQ